MFKIVSVNFPFLENPQTTKARPALCLTKPTGKHYIVIVAFITTQTDEVLPTDVRLAPEERAFHTTGLKRASLIRLHKLTSVTLASIQGEIGTLSTAWERDVKTKLQQLFNL